MLAFSFPLGTKMFCISYKISLERCGKMLGINLQLHIGLANLTYREFALKLGVDTRTVTKWVSEVSAPSCDYVPKICSVLKISPNQLFFPGDELEEAIKELEYYDYSIVKDTINLAVDLCKYKGTGEK